VCIYSRQRVFAGNREEVGMWRGRVRLLVYDLLRRLGKFGLYPMVTAVVGIFA